MEVTSQERAPVKLERRVVACIDFAPSDEDVLQQAKLVCLRTGASLQVVHVFEYGDLSELTQEGLLEFEAEVESRNGKLQGVVEKLHVPSLLISKMLLMGNVVRAIEKLVDDISPELLIVGTSGRRGVQRLLLGSTAEAILRSVSCPVLTVGPNSRSYKNGPVVFATDFNPCASSDLSYALALAERLRVPLDCVHFLPPKAFKSKQAIIPAVLVEALEKLTADAGAAKGSVRCFVEPGSHLNRDIVEFARKTSASAIVLGVLKRSSVQSHLANHETFKILATAPCPVYTLSHTKEELAAEAMA
jgi:nucleotide-binding universal stress UspA family protein